MSILNKKQPVKEKYGFRDKLRKLANITIALSFIANPFVFKYVSKRASGNYNNSFFNKNLEQKVEVVEKLALKENKPAIYPLEDKITPKTKINKYAAEYYTQEQLEIIKAAAEKYNINEVLIMAIGRAENSKEYPFGIMPNRKYNKDKRDYKNKFEKNAYWCAATLSKRKNEFEKLNKKSYDENVYEFIRFAAKSYSPVGAKNDSGTNRCWPGNVTKYTNLYSN